jgi:Yip1-like protein
MGIAATRTMHAPRRDARIAYANGFRDRLVRAIRLDESLYDEVDDDPAALGQAAGVVGLAGVATALAGVFVLGPRGFMGGLALPFVTWAAWATIVWAIGAKVLMRRVSDFEELLRPLGFAMAPQLLWGIAIVPIGPLQGLVGLAVMVLSLIAVAQAIHHALDIDLGRAALASLVTILAYWTLVWLVAGFADVA